MGLEWRTFPASRKTLCQTNITKSLILRYSKHLVSIHVSSHCIRNRTSWPSSNTGSESSCLDITLKPQNNTGPDMSPMCSMALVYLPTKLGDFVAYVDKYTIHGAHGSIQKFNALFMSSPTNQVLRNTNWLVYIYIYNLDLPTTRFNVVVSLTPCLYLTPSFHCLSLLPSEEQRQNL